MSSRRTIRPVRQLSLQQPGPHRQYIRRQRSAEDEKTLQIYANTVARNRVATNMRNGMQKPKVRVAWGEDRRNSEDLDRVEVVARQIPSRSRPTTGRSIRNCTAIEKASILCSRQELAERLRLAWKHREQKKANIDIFLAHGAVENRCDSELSISIPSTPLPEKQPESIKNEKQIPWNLEIAQSTNMSQTNVREKSNKFIEEAQNADIKNHDKNIRRIDSNDDRENQRKALSMAEENFMIKTSDDTLHNTNKESRRDVKHIEKSTDSYINPDAEEKKKTHISIDCTNLHLTIVNQSRSSTIFPSLKQENATIAKVTNDDFSLAKQKRASFHSGNNRAFLIPMPEKSTKEFTETKCSTMEKSILAKATEMRCASASEKISIQKQRTETRLSFDKNSCSTIDKNTAPRISTISEKARRTNSAPPQRRSGSIASTARLQVNIVIDTPGISTESITRSIACGIQEKTVEDRRGIVEGTQENSAKICRDRSIRSASVKRRSKSAKRRFIASELSTKDEEDTKTRKRCERRAKIPVDARTTDVVTMVSLVSSADSDSEVENSPGDDKLINELRSKLPTTPIIKTSINPNPGLTRKPIKSVSFQRDSSDDDSHAKELQVSIEEKRERMVVVQPCYFAVVNSDGNGNEGTLSSRQDIPDVAILPVSILIQNTEEIAEAPLTDREKRCLAVPIGDFYDKKRKLLRTRSIPSHPNIREQTNVSMATKEQRPQLTMSRTEFVHSPSSMDNPLLKMEQFPKEKSLPSKEAIHEDIQNALPSEPRFQTTKEKECWHLYRKMCDKGVCVSFDTVLRGMLTPTEYRLRQKELSQDLQ